MPLSWSAMPLSCVILVGPRQMSQQQRIKWDEGGKKSLMRHFSGLFSELKAFILVGPRQMSQQQRIKWDEGGKKSRMRHFFGLFSELYSPGRIDRIDACRGPIATFFRGASTT